MKENRDIKVQIRITSTEKDLLAKLLSANKKLTISKLFRQSLYESCKKLGLTMSESV